MIILLLASVSRYTLSQVVPHLNELFLKPEEISNRPPILLLLSDLINAARDSTVQNTTDKLSIPLTPYKDEVLGLVSVGLKVAASRLPALAVIRGLITMKSLLSDEELGFIVHLVNEAFQSGEEEDFR